MKTASGLSRFQEEKDLGSWFTKLLPVVMSCRNCQPGVTFEPSVIGETMEDQQGRSDNEEESEREGGGTTSAPTTTKSSFVPLRKKSGRQKEMITETLEKINSTIDVFTKTLQTESKTSNDMFKLFEEESKR